MSVYVCVYWLFGYMWFFVMRQLSSVCSLCLFNLFAGVPGEPLPVTSEEDLFDYIGLEFKTPEQRNL